ncbi:hypothetical protein Goari_000082, partial [Gossypium aridum]|nr:hypothetical protein [Gossypium aridum]
MILPKCVARLVTEMENKMMVEKEGLKSCHEAGVEEGKQDYLIDKQKKQKMNDDRKKKQKTNNINNQRKRRDLEKFMELGLEPPPDMPQVFKDCIKGLGGSEIKLIIQKYLQWNIGSSLSYIINGDYSKVLKNNRDSLKPNAVVQIWSFRVQPNSQLGFALIKIIDGEDG